MDGLVEPLYMWTETYIMQSASGRRKAVSTEVKLLDIVKTTTDYWDKLEYNSARTANLCSLHVFKGGVTPQYDDAQNANGGHFKMKPHTVDSAHLTLKRLSIALIEADFPNNQAVNGITIAKKAKSSLIKVWIKDSLNQQVIAAMNQWFDANVEQFCGRRLFSPHKYILKTFSRQQAKERQESFQAQQAESKFPHRTSGELDATSSRPPQRLITIPASPTASTYSQPDRLPPSLSFLDSGHWSLMHSPRTMSDSEFSGPGTPPLDLDPMSPLSGSWGGPLASLERAPSRAEKYAASLSCLMSCPRSDPSWAECTAAAVSVRLEATMRKCTSWHRSVSVCRSLDPAPLEPATSEITPDERPSRDLDIYG